MQSAVSEIRLRDFRPGTRHRLQLKIDVATSLPVLVAVGALAGKTLVVTASVHGDEYEGVRAVLEVFDELDASQMAGNWIGVPVANPPAFWKGTRTSPEDQVNMARIMPGKVDGTISERLAFALSHDIVDQADFYLDLHSGGITYCMPTMVGCSASDPRSRAAAEAFGAPVIWSHAAIAAGRTISYADARGIPWLYTEAHGAGRIDPVDLAMMKMGIWNLLKHLRIVRGEPIRTREPLRLRGDGNTDNGLTAKHSGFLLHAVEILQEVQAGDLLGTLVSPLGEVLEEYHAAKAGIVGMIRAHPVARPGDSLFLLAEPEVQ